MPASSFPLIVIGSGAQERFAVENCSPSRRGDPQPGHGRNKVIFHLAAIKHIIAGLMANSEESQTISQEGPSVSGGALNRRRQARQHRSPPRRDRSVVAFPQP